MTEAKRYDMEYVDFHSEMVECESGEYVRHKDYALLQSRLELLEKDAERIDWMDKVGRVNIERVREGHIKGKLRWDVEYGYCDDLGKSKNGLRDAIDAAMQASKVASE